MLSYEVIRNDTYSNKLWSIISQMEREMCSYLEWQLNVEPTALIEFQEKVKRDFKGPGPYPTHRLHAVVHQRPCPLDVSTEANAAPPTVTLAPQTVVTYLMPPSSLGTPSTP
ncbi:uncharacterized protein PHACADRAFT_191173 [Phanerochaete carnosa HHB-10118-sp]|uniref:Cyclin N-terminal domain-containing protein n=1 Tax=Phanerochaete carnosa (strain HHB-10118-sp) TaxID=650164 RepID=K5WIE1_PHACS|nr:uncharacterized protein PHACADRAFT_191173 [Phanerochaete carnosa HHB-10118-sp]EKM58854.1 hypothetical protein PHACADRAFT_191173 [Phanerochaete carnosa HHB-10118-sp]